MSDQEPSLEQWRRLYAVAGRVKKMAPWQWMPETDLFAIQHPYTGEVGWVSVMGALGEHLAVALYPGASSFYGFWQIQTGKDEELANLFFTFPQLQASFEDRDELDERDREVIRALDLKYRGQQAWPQFRSYQPGYVPWYLEAPHADWLYWTLEQTLEVAPRFKSGPHETGRRIPTEFPARVPAVVGDTIEWLDAVLPAPPRPELEVTVEIDPGLLESVRELKRRVREIEADLGPQPLFIGKPGERARVAFVLMAIDVDRESVVGTDAMTVESTVEALYGQAPGRLLTAIVKYGARPATISVRNLLLEKALSQVASAVGIRVERRKRLRTLDRAIRDFRAYLERR